MTWPLSCIGGKLSARSGINELMRDLADGISSESRLLMMGGGNPAHIPGVEQVWRSRWEQIGRDGDLLERMLGNYDGPHGSPVFIDALVSSLHAQYGWDLSPRNVALVNGSQNAFFYLFNMLAGPHPDGSVRKIVFPLSPEYIGYADQAMTPDVFRAFRPSVELIGDRRFKYHIDFDRLELGPDVAAICVSRPTNPTGNVLTDSEIERLDRLAAERNIPLIIDNAYGAPFPDILFEDINPFWSENTILVLSLSKLGLPGTRTGIIIGPEEIISAVASVHAVAGLANGNIGQAIAAPLLRDGSLYRLSRDVIRPFYAAKSRSAVNRILDQIPDDIPLRIHASEGALFLWLWFDDLPVSSHELYLRLKERGVIVVPGQYFFYGLDDEHPHRDQCLRLSYAMEEDVVNRGVDILVEEACRLYSGRRLHAGS